MEAALPPQHEARSDHAIFQGLARTLGFESEFTEGRSPRERLEKMWQASAETAKKEGFELPSFDEFWRHGQYRIPEAQPRSVWLSEFRQDPMKNPLRTPSGRIEIYSATIAAFEYQNCPGHPVWLEPFERVGGAMSDRYPLALLSPQPGHRLHSQLDHSGFSQAHKVRGKEVLTLHPRAAAERGVEEGMIVRVFNDRGACLAAAHLDDNMRDDVVVLPTGAWFARDPESGLELNGNPNVLTRDKGTSLLAQGPSPNTCMVEVELYEPVDHTGDPSHARVAWRPSKAS
jgi:biotin/methionine sulfoxide reductase